MALILAAGGFALPACPADAQSYAELRVAAAFQAADLQPVPAGEISLGTKGDLLPIGCAGPLRPAVAAECIDTAYELPSEQSVVVETLVGGAMSELMRLDVPR
jgi:hypothetical protein